jgi:threonine/homoserine/homoserine lactone efflux protein
MVWGAIRSPSKDGEVLCSLPAGTPGHKNAPWFWRGLMANLLNPKVGVFYVSVLPQFIPQDVPIVLFSTALAAIHPPVHARAVQAWR